MQYERRGASEVGRVETSKEGRKKGRKVRRKEGPRALM